MPRCTRLRATFRSAARRKKNPPGVRHRRAGKPGRGSKNKNKYAIEYENDYLHKGITVAEYEAEKGLPQYTAYPRADGCKPSDIGYFMYRNATEEEKMNLGLGRKFSKRFNNPEPDEEEDW